MSPIPTKKTYGFFKGLPWSGWKLHQSIHFGRGHLSYSDWSKGKPKGNTPRPRKKRATVSVLLDPSVQALKAHPRAAAETRIAAKTRTESHIIGSRSSGHEKRGSLLELAWAEKEPARNNTPGLREQCTFCWPLFLWGPTPKKSIQAP